ncbi:hypothetical protein KIPE111705_07110 [Kibdelosporangium persicum]
MDDSIPPIYEFFHHLECGQDHRSRFRVHRWVPDPLIRRGLFDHGPNVLDLCAEGAISEYEIDQPSARHSLGHLLKCHRRVPATHGHVPDGGKHRRSRIIAHTDMVTAHRACGLLDTLPCQPVPQSRMPARSSRTGQYVSARNSDVRPGRTPRNISADSVGSISNESAGTVGESTRSVDSPRGQWRAFRSRCRASGGGGEGCGYLLRVRHRVIHLRPRSAGVEQGLRTLPLPHCWHASGTVTRTRVPGDRPRRCSALPVSTMEGGR